MRFGSAPSSHPSFWRAALSLAATLAFAHAGIGQAMPTATSGPPLSRVDVYGGYGYFYPFNSDINNVNYPSVPLGGVVSVAGYFGRHFGLQAEGNISPKGPNDNNCVYTAQAGPIYRRQYGRIVPFMHVLGGGAVVGGPLGQTCSTWGYGGTGGFGADIILPILHDRIALRPIQADVLYAHIDNGPLAPGGFTGGIGKVTAFRASAGITLRLGNIDNPISREAPTMSCSTEPSTIFSGDPVTVTASTLDINPRRKPKYFWTTSGGKISGDGAVAAIDTTTLQAGPYEVTGKLVVGDKQRLVSSCSTSFTVKAYEPPTLTCAADKTTLRSGEPVAIVATGFSPQNRRLTYTYTTTSGLVAGNGPNASLTTVGVSPGSIAVTCNVMDDKGQAASARVNVTVAATATPAAQPTTPVMPMARGLCGITFDRDKRRPDRVDNEAKGCLDDIALTLNRETGDKLLVVGSHVAKESNRNAAERAMNAADYLTHEKGIDPARLDLRTGPDNSRAVAMMLVPPGASVDASNATSFDTSSVKRRGQAYGKPRGTTVSTRPRRAVHRRKRRTKPLTL
jgi:hypothetical protein